MFRVRPRFPEYVIYPHRIAQIGSEMAVLGHTTGSHLGLSNEEEQRPTLIWVAEVTIRKVRVWRLEQDSPENKRTRGLDRA